MNTAAYTPPAVDLSTPGLTAKDVVRAVDWLGAMDDEIDFDSADWSTAESDGMVRLEGYRTLDNGDREVIYARFRLVSVESHPHFEDEWDDDDE